MRRRVEPSASDGGREHEFRWGRGFALDQTDELRAADRTPQVRWQAGVRRDSTRRSGRRGQSWIHGEGLRQTNVAGRSSGGVAGYDSDAELARAAVTGSPRAVCSRLTGIESGATVQYSTDGGTTWTSSFGVRPKRSEHGEGASNERGENTGFQWGR